MNVRRAVAICAASMVLAAGPVLAQEHPAREIQGTFQRAFEQLKQKKYDDAIDSYARCLELAEGLDSLPIAVRREYRQLAHYNTACALSLQGKTESALEHFAKSLEHGFSDFDHIKKDTDLDNIRDEVRFKEIVAEARRRLHAAEEQPRATRVRQQP